MGRAESQDKVEKNMARSICPLVLLSTLQQSRKCGDDMLTLIGCHDYGVNKTIVRVLCRARLGKTSSG